MIRSYLPKFIALLCAAAVMPSVAEAAFPDRPVHFIVGFAPGGGIDAVSRLVAQALSDRWHQPVVVENRAGADGSIAEDVVAHSPADGYTLVWVTNAHTMTPSEYKLNYDAEKSFEPITQVSSAPDIMLAHPSFGPNSVQELIAQAKAKPGSVTFGSTGATGPTFLEMALFMKETGINMLHVSYQSTAAGMVAILGNEVPLMFGGMVAVPQIKEHKLKALAITGKSRSPALPDVPTVSEAANLPNFEGGVWYGVLAPAGTPKDVAVKIHDDMVAVLSSPSVKAGMENQGISPVGDSSAHFAQTIKHDIAMWGDILKDLPKK